MGLDEDLGIARHQTAEGRLSLFRADNVTVLFRRAGDGVYRKICHLMFNKKTGAIYAQFTYFRTDPGVVGLITTEIGADGRSTVDWQEGGKVATNLVKYSHPPDGRAHFSQAGSHRTQFWSESLDLHKDRGHLFEIHAFHLEPFQTLQKTDATGRRLFLPFQAEGLPRGVSLAVEWAPLEAISREANPGENTAGPVALIPRRLDGALFKAAVVAPPSTSPLRDHVVLINVHPLDPPATIAKPVLFFMGGWRKDQPFAPGSRVTFLSFSYPVDDPQNMARKLGVADFGTR